jgi:hypothetical protein
LPVIVSPFSAPSLLISRSTSCAEVFVPY